MLAAKKDQLDDSFEKKSDPRERNEMVYESVDIALVVVSVAAAAVVLAAKELLVLLLF